MMMMVAAVASAFAGVVSLTAVIFSRHLALVREEEELETPYLAPDYGGEYLSATSL